MPGDGAPLGRFTAAPCPVYDDPSGKTDAGSHQAVRVVLTTPVPRAPLLSRVAMRLDQLTRMPTARSLRGYQGCVHGHGAFSPRRPSGVTTPRHSHRRGRWRPATRQPPTTTPRQSQTTTPRQSQTTHSSVHVIPRRRCARLVAELGDGAACCELVPCVVRRHGRRLSIARFLQFRPGRRRLLRATARSRPGGAEAERARPPRYKPSPRGCCSPRRPSLRITFDAHLTGARCFPP